MLQKLHLCFILILLWTAAAIAAPPQRIISVSPNLTEILYGLGVFDRVVGVTDYCTYPPEAKSRERIGGYSTPNLERIVRLHPDLVVLTQSQAPILAYNLKQLGIRSLVTPSQSVSDVFTAIGQVGAAVGKPREAQVLIASTRATLEKVRNRTSGRARPAVVLAVDRSPGSLRDLYVATQGSYLADLVEIAGGHVVAPATGSGYSKISKETLVALNVDIVLELKPGSLARDVERARSDWQELPALKAVRNSRVYELTDDFIPHNSQLIARTVVLLAHILHPEIPLRELEAQ
jgi:iron complex transport system substrate-binding protein